MCLCVTVLFVQTVLIVLHRSRVACASVHVQIGVQKCHVHQFCI